MTRLLCLSGLLIGLTACFDFEGEKHQLGFRTNATLNGVDSWTPNAAMASGTELTVDVGEDLQTHETPDSTTWATSRGLHTTQKDGDLFLTGKGRQWVMAEADGVTDWFPVRFRDADLLQLSLLNSDQPLTEVAVLAGIPSPLSVQLLDHRDRALGFVIEQLEVDATVEVEQGSDVLAVVAYEDGEITVRWDNLEASITLHVVDPSEMTLILEEHTVAGKCVFIASGWANGLPVLDPGPIQWSHQEETSRIAPCGNNVEAKSLL